MSATQSDKFQTVGVIERMSKKHQNLIFGYIHDTESELNGKIIIPTIVIYLIAEFYLFYEWNQEICGQNLEFNGNKVKKIKEDYCYSGCVFGINVTNKICDIFNIEFECDDDNPEMNFRMGYIKADKLSTCLQVKRQMWCLGWDQNKYNSLGITVCVGWSKMSFSDEQNQIAYLPYEAAKKFGGSGLFTLSFNFVTEELIVFHNGNRAGSIKFKDKSIFAALSLHWSIQEITVIKYELLQIKP
eukprot:221801_1